MASSEYGIRDNHTRGSVSDFLKKHIKPDSTLSVVSAYFTIYAFEALKDQLGSIERLDFLFGEPRFVRALDPEKSQRKAFAIEDDTITLQNRLEQKRVARECAEWIRNKVQIRSVRQSNLLHGKMYHIERGEVSRAILGSSNFTVRGLGLSPNNTNNIELNLIVDADSVRDDLKSWFDTLWTNEELVADVRADVLHYLAQLYEHHSPQFIYFKTLFHIFEQFLSEQARSGLLTEQHQLVDTEIWKSLFAFQKDGVKGAINKILAHNGCIIADSVGLGKTYEALGVIKYFELLNYRVLVLCPKKLRENWTVYQAQNNSELNPFVRDRFSYTVLSHTDLSRNGGLSGDIDLAMLNWGNYDLVVIDESHNFRNNTHGKRDESGEVISRSRYERLMEDIIQSGVKTKVLLLSATPVNNDLKDLRNQLAFLTEGRDDALRESIGIASLDNTLKTAQRTFADWAKQDGRNTAALLEQLSANFFTLLDEMTIARSRKHIQRFYADTIAQLGGFPERLKPVSVFADIDGRGLFPSYDDVNVQILSYKLAMFRPSAYVLERYRKQYEDDRVANFSQASRERFLVGMMKIGFLKRLESSVASFAITMKRTIDKITYLEGRIANFKRLKTEHLDLDIADLAAEALDDEELQAALTIGQKYPYQLAHLDIDTWLADLQKDKRMLHTLYLHAKDVAHADDLKLIELKRLIIAKVREPTTNKLGEPNRKVLVFTAFADTATYLYHALDDWAVRELGINIALVTGNGENRTSFGKADYASILTNFSPRAKKRAKMRHMPQDNEIDLLIATDCISEGQNLQDCDYLVNYDIHWNPVRIIQRFGRIDRIGSASHAVQLVNFWPTPDLNKYLNLKNRVEARMALVDITATGEDNLLKADEIETLAERELSYRDEQLKRLQHEVLDLEDFSESVTLNEFTLDDFRIELAQYIESNRKVLEEAPLGLYTVVPTDPAYPVIMPGVVFCLRQKGDTAGNEQINPLQPYFLVYVRDDDVVRYGFAQPKQILELLRTLCADKPQPYRQLCDIFDTATANGSDMSKYSALLEKAVTSITGSFKRRMLDQLQAGRGGRLIDQRKQAQDLGDFELITWLVIADGNSS